MKDTINLNGETYKKVSTKPVTHVYAILDRSGSMSQLTESTIEGYNGFVDGLRKDNVELTLVLFDNEYEVVLEDTPIKDVPKLDKGTYFARGGTALIDAVCKTLKGKKLSGKDKAVVLIITDGMENMSHQYSTNDMKNLVETLEGKKNWTFTYLGANQDAWGTAQKWGFRQGNVANYAATDTGTRSAFVAMSVNTSSLANSTVGATGKFYGTDKVKDK